MLCGQGVQITSKFAQCRFGISNAQFAGLLERGKRVIDARHGLFIWVDVEIADCVVDQLHYVSTDC